MAVACACATVDPRPDYDRVAEMSRASTGYAVDYRPERDDAVDAEVEAMLADGLTVDVAARVALLNNPGLQASFYDVGVARADVVQAGLLSNPTLGVSARFPSGGGLAGIEAGLAQSIIELWQIPVRRESAERSLDRAVLQLAQRITQTAHDTRVAYYRAVAAMQLRVIADQHASIAENLLEMARARREAGVATALETNLARSSALEADLGREAARLDEADARRALARLMGVASDPAQLVLTDALPETAPDVTFEAAAVAARAHRLDLRAGRQLVAETEANLRLEWHNVFPSIVLGVELEREARRSSSGRDWVADTVRASVREGALTAPEIRGREPGEGDTDLVIGPSLSIELPVFDQNQAQIAKAEFLYERSRKELEALARGIAQDVRGAVDRHQTSKRVVGMYEGELIPLSQNNLEISRVSYKSGHASFLSVLEAQRFLLATRRGHVAALRDLANASISLEREMGVPIGAISGEVAPGAEAPGDD